MSALTIVALFEDREAAAEAVEALLDNGFTRGDIDSVTEVGPDAGGKYAEAVRAGNILVAVRGLGNLDERALSILQEYRPQAVETHPFSWQEVGWEGFEVAPSETEVDAIDDARAYYEEMEDEWKE